jgi:hypothetical protein
MPLHGPILAGLSYAGISPEVAYLARPPRPVRSGYCWRPGLVGQQVAWLEAAPAWCDTMAAPASAPGLTLVNWKPGDGVIAMADQLPIDKIRL